MASDATGAEADWGLEPKRTGMGWETKIGLVVILLLVVAFGYLLMRKLQTGKAGAVVAASETEAGDELQPEPPEETFSEELDEPPEQDPFAEPRDSDNPTLAADDFQPDEFEPAAEFDGGRESAQFNPDEEFGSNDSFDPNATASADPFAEAASEPDPFQEQAKPVRAQPVEFTDFETEAEDEEVEVFTPQPVRQVAESDSPFAAESATPPARTVSNEQSNTPFGEYEPVAEESTSATSTTMIKPGAKTSIPKDHPARAGTPSAGASPFDVVSDTETMDDGEAAEEFNPNAVAGDTSLESDEFDPGTSDLFDPEESAPDPSRTASNEREFDRMPVGATTPARSSDPFGEYEAVEEVEVRAGGTTQVVRPQTPVSNSQTPGYTTPPKQGISQQTIEANRKPAPASISIDEFETDDFGMPKPTRSAVADPSPFDVSTEQPEQYQVPSNDFDTTPQAFPQEAATYVVQPNDNYWRISKVQYGTGRYFQALAKHNVGLVPDPRQMKPGITISTPAASALEVAYPDLIPKGSQTTNYQGTTTGVAVESGFFVTQGRPMYRVGSNDTLSGIAQQHLGRASRWHEIYQLNESALKGPDRLKIGTVLTLPTDASQHRVVRAAPESRY